MYATISLFIESHGINSLTLSIGDDPCKGRVIENISPEAKSTISNLKRIQFLVSEINRLRELLGTEFSSKAPKHVFDKVCKDLYTYEIELENWDKELVLHDCSLR